MVISSTDDFKAFGCFLNIVSNNNNIFICICGDDESNKDKMGYSDINWGARSTNKASQKLAEKHGFKKLDKQYEKGWVDYTYNKRRN